MVGTPSPHNWAADLTSRISFSAIRRSPFKISLSCIGVQSFFLPIGSQEREKPGLFIARASAPYSSSEEAIDP